MKHSVSNKVVIREGATPFLTPQKGLKGKLLDLIIPSQISCSKAYKNFAKKNHKYINYQSAPPLE
jgi:hypothetical protein